MKAYETLGRATAEAGPLDAKTRELVKLAVAIGAGREGAVHSHTRRALDLGCSSDEIRHAVLLSTTTLGFPGMMAALTWTEDVLGRE
jgi:4-carboxymuconolactone decarboxylase